MGTEIKYKSMTQKRDFYKFENCKAVVLKTRAVHKMTYGGKGCMDFTNEVH